VRCLWQAGGTWAAADPKASAEAMTAAAAMRFGFMTVGLSLWRYFVMISMPTFARLMIVARVLSARKHPRYARGRRAALNIASTPLSHMSRHPRPAVFSRQLKFSS
jgi:hypothetical protein